MWEGDEGEAKRVRRKRDGGWQGEEKEAVWERVRERHGREKVEAREKNEVETEE